MLLFKKSTFPLHWDAFKVTDFSRIDVISALILTSTVEPRLQIVQLKFLNHGKKIN